MSNKDTYLGEVLAAAVLLAVEKGTDPLTISGLERVASEGRLLAIVQKQMDSQSNELYNRGIHAEDAAKIVETLLPLRRSVPTLHYPADVRAVSALWWSQFQQGKESQLLRQRAISYQQMKHIFQTGSSIGLAADLTVYVSDFVEENFLFDHLEEEDLLLAGLYLAEVLGTQSGKFLIPTAVVELCEQLRRELQREDVLEDFDNLLRDLAIHPREQLQLIKDWLRALMKSKSIQLERHIHLAAVYLTTPSELWQVCSVNSIVTVTDVQGSHSQITNGCLDIEWDGFLRR